MFQGHCRGYGALSANGGKGYGDAGGGGGGRIAIHTRDANEYKGSITAYGSPGTMTGDTGGPGTVFIEDRLEPFTYQSRLYLDGRDLYPTKPVVIYEKNPRHATAQKPTTNNADIDIEHIMLNNMVRVLLLVHFQPQYTHKHTHASMHEHSLIEKTASHTHTHGSFAWDCYRKNSKNWDTYNNYCN